MNRAESELLIMLFFRKDGSLNLLGKIALILGILLAGAICSMLSGCCNIIIRSETNAPQSKSKPYFCSPHPYYCTASVWSDCICAPWHLNGGPDAIWPAIATMTYPFWIVDEVCEVALDTLFFPVDGIYEFCKDKPNQPQGEPEIIQDVSKYFSYPPRPPHHSNHVCDNSSLLSKRQAQRVLPSSLTSNLCPAKSFTQNNHSSGCGERRARNGGTLTTSN